MSLSHNVNPAYATLRAMAKKSAPRAGATTPEMVTFGGRLQQEAERLGLTQAETGKRSGVDQGAISRLYNGKGGVLAYKLVNVLRALGKSGGDVTYIVTGERSPRGPALDVEGIGLVTTERLIEALESLRKDAGAGEGPARVPPRTERHRRQS